MSLTTTPTPTAAAAGLLGLHAWALRRHVNAAGVYNVKDARPLTAAAHVAEELFAAACVIPVSGSEAEHEAEEAAQALDRAAGALHRAARAELTQPRFDAVDDAAEHLDRALRHLAQLAGVKVGQ